MIKYKDYEISVNEAGGYVLSRRIPATNDRKERLDNICYPSTIESAIKKIQQLELGKKIDSNTYTLGEVLAEIRIIKRDFENSLKVFNGV